MATKTVKIKLESSAGTGYFLTTTKTNNVTGKLELNKYDPVVRKHVPFKEKKIK